MTLDEVRKRYLRFFEKRGHAIISSSGLVPENDPTTLFTGSGMQPLLPYLLGAKHPSGKKLVNSQKCFRSVDIDEVGDNRHTSFFEMLGNWSLGDYFKKDQLSWFFEFLTDEIHINPKRLYVTVFSGDSKNSIPKDTESSRIWKEIFANAEIDANEIELNTVSNGYEEGMQGGRIFYYGVEKNWWSRSGQPDSMPEGEPGGPDSEVFFEFSDVKHDTRYGRHCHPNCECGRYMEIGNSVFMEYVKVPDGSFKKLKKQNVDFGGGLERIAAASIGSSDIFTTDVFQQIIKELERLSGKKYTNAQYQRSFRIIADHSRSILFLMTDGVHPSNTDQGYFVRRLIRRSVRHMDLLGMISRSLSLLMNVVVKSYENTYQETKKALDNIQHKIDTEEEKFRTTLKLGLGEFSKIQTYGKTISGRDAFILFSSYGFPIDMTVELAKDMGFTVDIHGFEGEYKKHQEISRTGSEKKFKGGLADHSYETTKGHTATHLLLASLRKVLGDHVYQKGSNITEKRLRLDFSHPKKLTPEEIKEVENTVNEQIQKNLEVTWNEMDVKNAKKIGAMGVFDERYQKQVKVYSIGDFSKEICGGPHVKRTGELRHFKITEESSSSAGVRRIKAVVGNG